MYLFDFLIDKFVFINYVAPRRLDFSSKFYNYFKGKKKTSKALLLLLLLLFNNKTNRLNYSFNLRMLTQIKLTRVM